MYSTRTRPMNTQEKEQVQQELKVRNRGFFVQLALSLVALVFVPLLVGSLTEGISTTFFHRDGWLMVLPGAGVTLVIMLITQFRYFGYAYKQLQPYRQMVERGMVEEIHCTASEVVEIENETEEAQPCPMCWFFQVESNRMLILYCDLLPEDAQAHFPCTDFTLIRLEGDDDFLQVIPNGQPLTPQQRQDFTEDEYVPEDGELLPGTLARLDEILRARKLPETEAV